MIPFVTRRWTVARSVALVVALVTAALCRPAVAQISGLAATLVLGQASFTTNTAFFGATGLSSPLGVAIDPTSGKVFVADAANDRVLRYADASALATGAAAEAVLGQPDFTTLVPGTSPTQLFLPSSVAVDATGRLWVADQQNNRVLGFANAASTANGAAADVVLGQPNFTSNAAATTQSGMNRPTSVAVDPTGRLWVADAGNNRVLRFDNDGYMPNGDPAFGVLGQPDFTSTTTGASATTFAGVQAVATDNAGTLWVVDGGANRVLRFANAAALGYGGAATGVLGQADFVSLSGGTTASTLSWPNAAAVDRTGWLWVADGKNNRVLGFANAAGSTNGAAATAVVGQADFTSSGSGLSATGLLNPSGITLDATRALWVADQGNNRLLRYELGLSAPAPAPVRGHRWLPLLGR